MKLPDWAVPDQLAINLLPEKGWLTECVEYGVWSCDAPTILHLGSAMTALCTAASQADIVIERPGQGQSQKPLVLWSLLIAPSGSRKSTAAKIPMGMLRRATQTSPDWGSQVVLPSDGSIEAWTDWLVNHNNAILYRTEFSTVLTQAGRSYTAGLKPWLLSLYEADEEWHRQTIASGPQIIERPRVSVLGPIPPKVFAAGVDHIDWSTGFLARMTYWLGVRDRRNPVDLQDPDRVTKMTLWLHNVACRTRGKIKIREEQMWEIDRWVLEHIEERRGTVDEDVFSHLDRYQGQIYVFAALYALSRRVVPQTRDDGQILVEPSDVGLALSLAKVLLDSTLEFFSAGSQAHAPEANRAQRAERIQEERILKALRIIEDPEGLTIPDLLTELGARGMEISRATLYRLLKSLRDSNEILMMRRGKRTRCRIAPL